MRMTKKLMSELENCSKHRDNVLEVNGVDAQRIQTEIQRLQDEVRRLKRKCGERTTP